MDERVEAGKALTTQPNITLAQLKRRLRHSGSLQGALA